MHPQSDRKVCCDRLARQKNNNGGRDKYDCSGKQKKKTCIMVEEDVPGAALPREINFLEMKRYINNGLDKKFPRDP